MTPRRCVGMSGIYGKGARAKATKLHSLYVRTRDDFTCQKCGKTKGDGVTIQCAHIVSRKYGATRTDERNALALCAKCHWFFGEWPLEFYKFIADQGLLDIYEELKTLALDNRGKKKDYDAEVDRLQAMLDDLNE